MTSVPPPGGEDLTTTTAQALEPLSRRLLQIAGGLSVLLIVLVVFAWMHGGSSESSLNPIAEAAARTQQASGARLAVHYEYTYQSPLRTISATGEGVYNGKTGRSRLSVSVPIPNGNLELEGVGDSRTAYLRSDAFKAGLPPGDEWMGIEVGLANSAETSAAGSSDLKAQLDQLRAVSGGVETLGQEEVRGVETTRYRSSFDLADYASYLRRQGSRVAAQQYERVAKAVPTHNEVEVWVDANDLVRRVKIRTIYLKPKPAQPRIADMTIEYFDFGITPAVRLPGPGTVFDMTPVARAELGLLDGSSEMPPLSSPHPLSSRAFHSRARALCASTEKQLARMKKRGQPAIERMKRTVRRDGLKARATLEAFRAATSAYYEPALRKARRALRRLARLAPPPSAAPQYKRLVRISARSLEIDLAETRAAEIGQFALAHRLSTRLRRLEKRSKRLARQIGLQACEDGEATTSP
ncbi:MAG: hypothetical protein ACM3N0_12670 [Chloroflexota bacterium]